MIVWLFKDGEQVPFKSNDRRMRTGMLANALVERGHVVKWFTSTFDHVKKRNISKRSKIVKSFNGVDIHFVHAGKGFSKNFSVRRFLFYRRYSKKLKLHYESLERPHCIICCFPLIDVAFQVTYGSD